MLNKITTPLKIAVASGKGGTGKTSVAVNMAAAGATKLSFLDCDAEAPNAHLFFHKTQVSPAANSDEFFDS
ncbi:MAG TPA: P-loop NTPase, partial [Candidatus Wallbacteria bacterium]|nr:P-loop NTPase [Candidatus Wallbacteria bacterium]